MNDSVKLFLVTCGNCKTRQVWDASTSYRQCGECDASIVLRTASYEQVQAVKKETAGNPLTFSNYLVYTLGPDEIEVAVTEKKRRQKVQKEEIAERKVYAESVKYAYPAFKGTQRKAEAKSKPSKKSSGKKASGASSKKKGKKR